MIVTSSLDEGEEVVPNQPINKVQLKLRMTEKVRKRIELAAKREGRSMNSEIIRRLEMSFILDDDITRLLGLYHK